MNAKTEKSISQLASILHAVEYGYIYKYRKLNKKEFTPYTYLEYKLFVPDKAYGTFNFTDFFKTLHGIDDDDYGNHFALSVDGSFSYKISEKILLALKSQLILVPLRSGG